MNYSDFCFMWLEANDNYLALDFHNLECDQWLARRCDLEINNPDHFRIFKTELLKKQTTYKKKFQGAIRELEMIGFKFMPRNECTRCISAVAQKWSLSITLSLFIEYVYVRKLYNATFHSPLTH